MIVRSRGAFWGEVDGRTIVCEPASGELYELNRTATILWEACDGATVESLVALLAKSFPDQTLEQLTADTARCVRSLGDKGLVTLREL